MSNINFIVNEEKRTVVCVIEDVVPEIINVLCKYDIGAAALMEDEPFEIIDMVSKLAPDTIRGIAVCHPDDAFDPAEGKKIAYRRAQNEYIGYRNAVIHKRAEDLRRIADNLEKYGSRKIKRQ